MTAAEEEALAALAQVIQKSGRIVLMTDEATPAYRHRLPAGTVTATYEEWQAAFVDLDRVRTRRTSQTAFHRAAETLAKKNIVGEHLHNQRWRLR